jgi:hypothetical protein
MKGPNPKYKPYWKIVTSNWKLVAPWLGGGGAAYKLNAERDPELDPELDRRLVW